MLGVAHANESDTRNVQVSFVKDLVQIRANTIDDAGKKHNRPVKRCNFARVHGSFFQQIDLFQVKNTTFERKNFRNFLVKVSDRRFLTVCHPC